MKKTFLAILIASAATNATEVVKWRGNTLNLDLSVRNPSHLVFDEEIERHIYPKEENLEIIRKGKNVYFRYSPLQKFKIVKTGKTVNKTPAGIEYKGSPVKIWFIGAQTGTSYSFKINPVETEEDTFYIKNESATISKEIANATAEPRTKKITTLAKNAAAGNPISGYTFTQYSKTVKNTSKYEIKHIKGYKGLMFEVDVYSLYAKKTGYLNEFEFVDLSKKNKAYIGIVDGWKTPLKKGQYTNIIIVSEK